MLPLTGENKEIGNFILNALELALFQTDSKKIPDSISQSQFVATINELCSELDIVPRKMKTYLSLFEQYALPIQRRHLGDPLGYFIVEHGPLHQVVHFWGYDNLADLEMRRAKRDADPEWTEYQKKTEGLVVSQENKLCRPADWSPIK